MHACEKVRMHGVRVDLSKHEMDRGEGLKWLTKPVYISKNILL